VKEQRKRRDGLSSSEHYTADSCCTVYTKLAFAFLTVPEQLRRYIEIDISSLFVSSCYSNAIYFGPIGHHQVYKLQRKLITLLHFAF
jgi:hypothetical protein